MKALPLFAALMIFAPLLRADPQYGLDSPDGRIHVQIDLSRKIYYSVQCDSARLIALSPLSLELGDGTVLGLNPRLLGVQRREHDGRADLPWGRNRALHENYRELEASFAGNFSVVFRAYNDGVAYRFRTARPGDLIVKGEELQWNLPMVDAVEATDCENMAIPFEGLYHRIPFAEWKSDRMAYAPVLVERTDGYRLLLCDADLHDYPGLFLQKAAETNRNEIRGRFANVPRSTTDGGWCHFDRVVTATESYVARTTGSRDFPWRVTVIARNDGQLLESELLDELARPSAISDTSWLTPGQSAWDWWSDWNLTGQNFRTGINTATYHQFVDFASENHLPYLVVDEGWSNAYDIALLNPDLDIAEVVRYAKSKGVKIILWCTWKTLTNQWDAAFAEFTRLGAAGIKVDFFDRDDQVAINSMEAIAQEAAARHLIVDFHGCHALAGFSRTYPNVFGFEGVRGNEYNKFSPEPPSPTYNTTLPFTRGMAAQMDFTPGGMRNVAASDYAPSNSQPKVIGTRCHQLAMYVVYASPLPMLCDSPSAYRAAPDFLSFLCDIPSTWDESRGLSSKVGELAAVARRQGTFWYVGLLGGAEAQTVTLDLSFAGPGTRSAVLAADTPNSDRLPTDYRIVQLSVDTAKPFEVKLAPGGGAVLKIEASQ